MGDSSTAGQSQTRALAERACAGEPSAITELEARCSRGKARGIEPWLAEMDALAGETAALKSATERLLPVLAARALLEGRGAMKEFAAVSEAADKECGVAWSRVPPLLRPGWNESVWAGYNPAEQQRVTDLPDSLCLGQIQAAQGSGPASPFLAPFVGQQRTLVLASEPARRQPVLDAIQSLIWRIALALPNQVRFLFLDPHNSGNSFRWANRLPGRIENTDLFQDLESAERNFVRVARNHLGGSVRSFEQIPTNQRRREKLQLVVVADFPRGFEMDSRSLELLRRIANNGMEGGTYLVLHWDTTAEFPRGFDMDQSGIKAFPHAWYPLAKAEELAGAGWRLALDAPPAAALQSALLTKLSQAEAIRSELSFTGLVGLPEEAWWRESSVERVVTPVGARGSEQDALRILLGESEDGQPCVHGVIGAGTGMGKSNLFHVFILGLAQRYSPEQLKFYLVDGKDGVEFRTYRRLPHSEVLSLNTSPQLARSLLADLAQEMERRNGIFRKYQVSGFKDYARLRQAQPDLPPLPRLVLVVDEYQELFEGDREGEASKYLALLGAQGRSAGLHMLLASQRFGASGMLRRDEIFSQIALRVAMKIAQAEVATLTEFQRAGKEAINALDGPGKVVLNDRSGQDGFNVSGIIALLRATEREHLVEGLAAHAAVRFPQLRAPLVFEGLAQPKLLDNPRLAALAALPSAPQPEELEHWVKRPLAEGGVGAAEWYPAEHPRIAWVGQEFNVRGYADLRLKRKRHDNLLIVGNHANARHGLLLSVLTSFALNLEGRFNRFVLLDRTPRGSPWARVAPAWNEHVARSTRSACRVVTDPGEVEAVLRELETELDTRKGLDDLARGACPSLFVVLLEPERFESLARQPDPYGTPIESPAGARLRRLFTEGPALGIHVILSTGSGRALCALIDLRKGVSHFDHRLLLQMPEDESGDLTGKRVAATLQADGDLPICALIFNADTGSLVRFKPPVAARLESGDDSNHGALAELPALAQILARRSAHST